jgi:RND family efflux transporter MFP subunit
MKFESPLLQRQAELDYQKQMLLLDEEETKLKNQRIINQAARMRVLMDYEQVKSWVERIERRISELTLRAPTGGMVVYVEVGGHGTPRKKIAVGDKPWPSQPIMTIPDPSHMEAVMRVNEVDAGKLTIGDRAALNLDAFEQTSYTGTVTRISRLADKRTWRSQIKDFEVVIEIANPDSMLKPGMTTQARIILSRIPNALYVPTGAVFEQQDGKPVVFLKKNLQKPVPVILGKRNDQFIIIADGVRAGDEISLTPPVGKYYQLGRAREIERRAKELVMLRATPDSAFTPESRAFKSDDESLSTSAPSPVKPGLVRTPALDGDAPVRPEAKQR